MANRFPGCSWRSLPAGGTLVGPVVKSGTSLPLTRGDDHVAQKLASLLRGHSAVLTPTTRPICARAATSRTSGSSSTTMPAATDHRCSERGSTSFPPFVRSDGVIRIPKCLPDRPAFDTAIVPYLPLDGEFVPTTFVRDVLQSLGASSCRRDCCGREGDTADVFLDLQRANY